MAMRTLQQRITFNSLWCGCLIALLVVTIDVLNLLRPFDYWLYDVRAARCQTFTPQPSSDIVYLDVDDNALDTIGHWPWNRSIMANVLDEVRRAQPKSVGIDVLYVEPQDNRIVQKDDQYITVADDQLLADQMKQLDNVILANSLAFLSNDKQSAALRTAAINQIKSNLRITPENLVKIVAEQSKNPNAKSILEAMDFATLRRAAVRLIIHDLFNQHITDPNEIIRRLASNASTQPSLDTTLTKIIENEYQHVISENELESTSIPLPGNLKIQPPDSDFENIPIPTLAKVMSGSGFANYNIFTEPVVRRVPLFLKRSGKLYPQFAFLATCRFLDADLSKARITDSSVTLPTATGEVVIPVRAQYSDSAGRSVGLIMDIPWFGTNQWQTMMDWPEHKRIVQHYPVEQAWSIIEANRRLITNNSRIDSAYRTVQRGVLSDENAIKRYESLHLRDDDFLSRKELALQAISDLGAVGLIEWARSGAEVIKSDEEKLNADAINTLQYAVEQNSKLVLEIRLNRSELASKLHNKLVFIGLTATATGDFVTTSLHPSCPGVVVHGVLANAIINRDFLNTAPNWVTHTFTIALGLLVTLISTRFPPIRTLLLSLLIAIAYLVVNGFLFYDRWNWIVRAAPPLTAILACWSGCMIIRLIVETMERIRMKRDAAIIEHEISLAQQVQAALIPKELAIISSVDSHGWTLAATTTGGDCFDLWRLADGRLGILVADASGHGLGPSIVVSQVRALVRALCDLYKEPQNLLERINQRMTEDLEGKKFCTTFVGFLSTDGTLSWGSAGHGPMLWASSIDAEPQEIGGTAMPLGVSIDYFGDESVPAINLGQGGWLIVVSDGIFEAANPAGDQYGIERVKACVLKSLQTDCVNIIDTLRKDVLAWQAKPTPDDDQTIVFIKIKDIQSSSEPAEPATETPASQAE